ncbi:MAG: type IV secretion system DNA-binding domain-containing protein [Patescibacteria group bacterium]|nr:type IV secretion system DNA-binding domain-containing protein [Patescibacteria group bacterium]
MKHFLIKIPSTNPGREKTFFQLLHALYETLRNSQVSLEIITKHQHTLFAFTCADRDASLISGQIYSLFPESEIEEIPDLLDDAPKSFFGGRVDLERPDLYPVKTFDTFSGDSLSGLLSVLSKASLQELVMFQIVVQPRQDTGGLHFMRNWKKRIDNLAHSFRVKYWFKKGDFKKQFKDSFAKKESERLFSTSMRFAVFEPDITKLEARYHSIAQAFSQYTLTDFNQFVVKRYKQDQSFYRQLKSRVIHNPYLLSQSEIATLYHFPDSNEVPNLVYVLSKKAEPPVSLPTDQTDPEVSFFGMTNFHNNYIPFGIYRKDRRRHFYIVGKSGSGKSKMIELLIKSDLERGHGVGVLDPHGDLVDNALRFVPKDRVKDVVLFDPSDDEFPVAFNPLEKVPSALKMRVTIGFLEIFHKLFGSNWSDRLEHVLRYTVLALLDSPNTTVLSIMKMLTDKNYRQYIVKNIEDDVVRKFWVNEFAGWSEKFDAEAITPLLNKVGQFVATNMIRNIVGQPENKIHFRKIMDEGKILLMKVSKGMLGEENAQLMGAFAITKIFQAALSRADIPEEERRDFFLYVDEFQNFATDTFDEILSEARKYRLCLTIANQFLGQLSSKIKTTVFGNVGSMLSFRVGAEDASTYAGEYNPVFSEKDLINLGVRDFYTKMSINGETTQPFSGKTLNCTYPEKTYVKEIVDTSRSKYCLPKDEVQKVLAAWEEGVTTSADASNKKGADGGHADAEEEDFNEPII